MKNKYFLLLLIIFLVPLYFFLYKIYIPKVNAFGCFDDCNNIVAGYFISKGKALYSQIPFNHQMLMAYISYFIQGFSHPINIYELILRHRQFVFIFGFLMNILIVLRFRIAGFGFMLFYEFSKFYVFGDRFLAEGLIVYPIVYMVGVTWYKLNNKKIYSFEHILSAIFTWFVIFMCEPYIPVAILLYTLSLWGRPFLTVKKYSLLLFLSLFSVTLFLTSFKDYFFNVVYVNFNGMFRIESGDNKLFGTGIFKVFLYPFYLYFDGKWNIFRYFILGLDTIFLTLVYLVFLKKKLMVMAVIFLVLGVSNIRYVEPGQIFYGSFHMLLWYGVFIMILFLMLADTYSFNKKLFFTFSSFLTILFIYIIISPRSFIHDKVNPHEEFMTNYGHYLQVGEVIKKLSNKGDTLFVDGFDELIHWQADLPSSYFYNWYTAFMPNYPKYYQARLEMFIHNPPDFYYGTCPKEEAYFRLMPEDSKKDYQRLYSVYKPTCLFIKNSKIAKISNQQWKKAKEFLYELPVSSN